MGVFTILSTCKGGGYRYCRTEPPHPKRNANGLYPLHRVLAENALGRLLAPDEVVHHRDEDKTNDDPSNLVVLKNSEHAALHQPEAPRVSLKCHCGKTFTLTAKRAAERIGRARVVSCSKACAGRVQQRRPRKESYRNGCRCDRCRASHAARMRDWKQAKRLQRGAGHARHR